MIHDTRYDTGYKVHRKWSSLGAFSLAWTAWARLSLHNLPRGQQVRQSVGHWAWAWTGTWARDKEAPSSPLPFPRPKRRHCDWSQDGKDAVCLIADGQLSKHLHAHA